MRSFERIDNRSLPEIGHERGSKQREQVLCLIPELMISQKWLVNLHTRPRARNNLGIRGCTEESGFDPMELWVMGPPCELTVGRAVTSCTTM